MITPEEIVDLAEYLKRKDIPSSTYQLFAARQVLLSEWGKDTGPTALVRLSNLLGPIFCRTAEDQRHFQDLYLEWLRQRSPRPRDRPGRDPVTTLPPPDTPTVHWRMKLAALSLLIVPLLTMWFLVQDLRTRQVAGQVLAEGKAVPHATVHLGKGSSTEEETEQSKTDTQGRFTLPFQAKEMPLEVTVEAETYLTAKIPVGDAIKANRNWFYFKPINLTDTLEIGTIQLTKEQAEAPPEITPDPSAQQEPPPSELSIEKITELSIPAPSWTTRLEGEKALGALLPLIMVLLWLAYRKLCAPALKRQASHIPPALKQVQIHTETHHLFPTISLRHLTQRLRQTRFVESAELDVPRTIQCTIQRGGLFTPVFGSRREPGYVALIDRTTMADHQAHLAAQLVQDLAKGSVLVRQYEFDEHPTMLKRVDPLRPVRDNAQENLAGLNSPEVMPLEDLHAKFPSRRLLCFGDPRLCFDPLSGKLRPWVETLEGWEERYWFSSNTDRLWGQPERILSRRGFHVVPLSHLGLQFFAGILEQQEAHRPFDPKSTQQVVGSHARLPERWLERHPPSCERLHTLLTDLEVECGNEKEGRSEERGRQGMRWLAACAAYPEIHWALTLEWGVRLFGHGPTAETLLPKLTRLVWFRHAFMPDWFRQALYDRLTKDEAENLSRELTSILSAATADSSEGMGLAIATGPTKSEITHETKKPGALRNWWGHLWRKLRLQAIGEAAEAGSPLRDYVMLQYLSGKQGKARLTPYAPKALLNVLFPKGQPWLGFRPFIVPLAAALATGGLWDWFDPIPVPLPSPTRAIALSSDGLMLAAGLEDGRVVEWNWRSKQIKQTYEFYPSPVTSMAVSPDGTFVAAGYQDGTIHVLEKDAGAETLVLKNHDSSVTQLAFWPGSQQVPQLVSVDQTGNILAWSLGTITLADTNRFNRQDVRALAFSPDGRWAAGGNREGSVWVATVTDGEFDAFLYQERSFSRSQDDDNPINNMAWDPTGRWILGRSMDGMVGVIDKETEQVLARIQGPVEGASGLSWPREEEAFLTVAGDEGPEVWRLQIPVEVLSAAVANIEQEKAAELTAQKETRLREQQAAEKERARREADKRAEAKRQTELAAKQKAAEAAKRQAMEQERQQAAKGKSSNAIMPALKGQVIDAGTKEPLEGVRVFLFDFKVALQTDASGHFEYSNTEIVGNTVRVVLSKEGYETWESRMRPGEDLIMKMPRIEMVSPLSKNRTPPLEAIPQQGREPQAPEQMNVQDVQQSVREQQVQQENQAQDVQQAPSVQQGTKPISQGETRPTRITGKDGVPMLLVPAGEFTMGAREDDKDAQDNERPAHQVYLDAFYIDQFEVTTSRYATFFQETKRDPPQDWSETVLKQYGQKPVVGVTWEDAHAYCEWAGKRLPTEAEWEKAARGTDKRRYPWGDDPPTQKLANFDHCCDFKDYGILRDVGSFESGKSPYGAYDMAGNVWEWVADWYDEKLYQQRATGKEAVPNPQGPDKGDFKLLRGGSWISEARNMRSSYRYFVTPTGRIVNAGFRCAQGAPPLANSRIDRTPPGPIKRLNVLTK